MKNKIVFNATIAAMILLFASTMQLKTQVLPAMTYGGVEDDRAYALVEATDNGYVLAGWTKSFGPGTPNFTNVLIVKTGTDGIPQGAKISIGDFDDEAYSMTATFDSGYAITGYTYSYGLNSPNFSNIFVLKLDANGVSQWSRVFSEPPWAPASNEEAYSIVQTMDGGYAVTGWTEMRDGTHDIFLLKLDPNGMFQWFKIYWFPLVGPTDEGYSVCETTDPNIRYLIAGRANVFQSPSFDAFVLPVDQFGNSVPGFLASIIPAEYQDEAYSVVWDGTNYVAAGWTNSFSTATPDIIIWRANVAGQFIMGKAYGWDIADEMVLDDRSLILTADGGYAVSGLTSSIGPGAPPNPNFLILKLDTMLNLQWGRVHPSSPGALTEEAYPMIQTQNQNYAIAGWTNSFCVGGSGDEDFHFLTLDSQGNRPVCVIDTEPPYEDIFAVTEGFLVDSSYLEMDSMPIIDTMVSYTEICSIPPGTKEFPKRNLPDDFELYASFDYIMLSIGKAGRVELNLYDISGRQLASLAHGFFEKGTRVFTLPNKLSTGVYFVIADFEGIRKSVKLVRLR